MLSSLLLADTYSLSKNIIVFPGKRPAHFLRKKLAETLESPFESPKILSMDEFIDHACESLGNSKTRLNPIDAVSIIFNLNKKTSLISNEKHNIDSFLPWGFKIFSDFEEMYVELTKTSQLKEFEIITGEKLPENINKILDSLSKLYDSFYKYLDDNELSTRASKYTYVANNVRKLNLDSYNVIFAGFFALTKSEQRILANLKERQNVRFIFQHGPGIDSIIANLQIETVQKGDKRSKPGISFYPAMDVHGEVFGLSNVIQDKKDFDYKDAMVLPLSSNLFPVVQHVLPFTKGYNISMGYPLFRTPIYSLLETLGRLLETRSADEYFIPDYLRFVLHPYVKNIYFERASFSTRIIFHTIEERFVKQKRRFIKLDEIESDEGIINDCLAKLQESGDAKVNYNDIVKHIGNIHKVLIKPFENINNIEDFSEKLLLFVSFISHNSPANMHPYTVPFFKKMIEGVYELKISGIRNEQFSDTRNYFRLLKNYFHTISSSFEGTPVKGLQVLGFLETRNIKFDTVYLLDANEGILPDTAKEDTLLPYGVRKKLGLSTHEERERISRYYFERLLNSAKEVHIFYVESTDREKSRFVERLIWNLQKETKNIELPNSHEISFKVTFNQKKPDSVQKTSEMVEFLVSKTNFSPSSLDDYLHCPLRFYYKQVLKLGEKEELTDNIEQMEVGTIVHDILETFFRLKRHKKLVIPDEDNAAMDDIVDRIFKKHYAGVIEGNIYLVKLQVKRRMNDILNFHRNNHPDTVIEECEKIHKINFTLPDGRQINLKGKIDRVDKRSGEIFIIDYKTGSSSMPGFNRFKDSERNEWYKTLGSVQLPFYIMLYLESHKDMSVKSINSALMLLGPKAIYETVLFEEEADKEIVFETYKNAILMLMNEVLDKNLAFEPASNLEKECTFCDFKNLCGTQWVTTKW